MPQTFSVSKPIFLPLIHAGNSALRFFAVLSLLVTIAAFAKSASAQTPGATVVVRPSSPQGWTTSPPLADNRAGGAVNFVFDSTTPAGIGALQLTTDATDAAKAQYFHQANVPLPNVTDLSYYTKQVSGASTADPSYQLIVYLDGTASSYTYLVYEPYWNGTIANNVWQQWNVAAGQFWSSKTRSVNGTCSVTAGAGGPPFYTLSDLKTNCPNAVVVAYGVNVGTYNRSYNVETDLFNFNGTVYDFEPDNSTLVVDADGQASATDCNAAGPASTTIQAAINAAHQGDTIKVCPGTYIENITVNKQLTILGPNADVNPNTTARGAEAIILPALSQPTDPNCNYLPNSAVAHLTAEGVTFNGFTIDGDNPNLTSGYGYNSADIDAWAGIFGTETLNPNAVVVNNIVKNTGEFGVYISGDANASGDRTGKSLVSQNKVDNVVGFCYGEALRAAENAFTDITDNSVTHSYLGVTVENFNSLLGAHPAAVVGNNQLTAYGRGVYHNLHYGYTGNGYTYSGNRIDTYVQADDPATTRYRGIMLESIENSAPVAINSNTIAPDRAALLAQGYTQIDGIFITNPGTDSPNISITGNNIVNALRGIAHVAPAVPTVTCNNLSGNNVGIYVGTGDSYNGPNTSSSNGAIEIHQNNIVGNTVFGVQSDPPASPQPVITNAENNYWGAPDGPKPTGSGDAVSSNVDYNPFLTAASTCAAQNHTGIEGDVTPRSTGNGVIDATDAQQIERFSVGFDKPYQLNEGQRADCAPRSTGGDGVVNALDVQQAERYSTGLDPKTPASGPATVAGPQPAGPVLKNLRDAPAAPRTLSVQSVNTSQGQSVTVNILDDAAGDEAGYTFSISYNQMILSNPVITKGTITGETVLTNATTAGQIGFSVRFGGGTIGAGNGQMLLSITFTVASNAPFGQTPINFTSTPAPQGTSDANAQPLATNYTNGTVTVTQPTAAPATVAGHIRSATGTDLSGVSVTLLNLATGKSAETITDKQGVYRFENVDTGDNYIITPRRFGYVFNPTMKSVLLVEDLTNADFTAAGNRKGKELNKSNSFPQ